MTYVLIAILFMSQKATSVTVEFNTREACQAAADHILATRETDGYRPVVFCAAKGKP